MAVMKKRREGRRGKSGNNIAYIFSCLVAAESNMKTVVEET